MLVLLPMIFLMSAVLAAAGKLKVALLSSLVPFGLSIIAYIQSRSLISHEDTDQAGVMMLMDTGIYFFVGMAIILSSLGFYVVGVFFRKAVDNYHSVQKEN